MGQFRNIAAEILEPLEQAADGLGSVVAVEVFTAEVAVLGAVAQHVVSGGQHGGRDGEDCLFLAPRRALIRRNWARR